MMLPVAVAVAVLAGSAGCTSQQPEIVPTKITKATPESLKAPPEPEVLSLAPSNDARTGSDIILSWRPIPGIVRFAVCETIPPHGTECEDYLGVSSVPVDVPGPIDDPVATGTWLKYLWVQACGERRCSKPVPAGAIVHRVVYGTDAWNFIMVARRLENAQVEVTLGNASEGTTQSSTLAARTPTGSEIARCVDLSPGEWCGPLHGALESNEIVGEQSYEGIGVTVQFPMMPVTTAPQSSS